MSMKMVEYLWERLCTIPPVEFQRDYDKKHGLHCWHMLSWFRAVPNLKRTNSEKERETLRESDRESWLIGSDEHCRIAVLPRCFRSALVNVWQCPGNRSAVRHCEDTRRDATSGHFLNRKQASETPNCVHKQKWPQKQKSEISFALGLSCLAEMEGKVLFFSEQNRSHIKPTGGETVLSHWRDKCHSAALLFYIMDPFVIGHIHSYFRDTRLLF